MASLVDEAYALYKALDIACYRRKAELARADWRQPYHYDAGAARLNRVTERAWRRFERRAAIERARGAARGDRDVTR